MTEQTITIGNVRYTLRTLNEGQTQLFACSIDLRSSHGGNIAIPKEHAAAIWAALLKFAEGSDHAA